MSQMEVQMTVETRQCEEGKATLSGGSRDVIWRLARYNKNSLVWPVELAKGDSTSENLPKNVHFCKRPG